MRNNFEEILEKLSRENTSSHPDKDKYDKLLLGLEVHYLTELSHMKPGKLLDVGCAYGTQSAAFAELGYKVKALDNMPEFLDEKWLKSKRVAFEKANIETDPLKENQADYIVFSEVLEHLCYSPVEPLRKLYKALKTGGFILCSTPMVELEEHRNSCTGRYCKYAHYRDIPEAWNGYDFSDAHHKLYRKGELLQLFHEVGFQIREFYPVNKGTHHYILAQKPDAKS